MNEQAEKVLVDLLKKASDGIDSAVAFSQAQLPDVVAQLLTWNFASSLIYFSLGISIFLTGILFPFVAMRQRAKGCLWTKYEFNSRSTCTSDLYDFSIVSVPISLIPVGLLMSLLSNTWLKILLAPKLYLIEYAASLIK
ncbi:hypothetical protein [Morganella morganii]|uniref:hypothetical protein n=1 Tax=Morganella morganii TaxID=582 RepID=UPI0023682317|nr:hypothetical protein [Morganella morganii]